MNTRNLLTRFNRMKRLSSARRQSAEQGLQEETTLALQIVDRDVLAEERALRDTRYIEYRYLTPWQATERFAEVAAMAGEAWHQLGAAGPPRLGFSV